MIEIFQDYYYKDIKTIYTVSNKGRVYNTRNKKYLRLTPNKKGYIRVSIYLPDGRIKRMSVHVMVAETFIGEKSSSEYQVDHIDGDKANNNVDNLEWVTPSENICRAYNLGLKTAVKGSDNPVSTYTEEQIHTACKLAQEGYSIPKISKKVNIPKSYLYGILRGDHWHHIVSQYDLSNINKIEHVSQEIKNEIGVMLEMGFKKSIIINILNNKYNGNFKNIVYQYRK